MADVQGKIMRMEGVRHRRKRIDAEAFVVLGGRSWVARVINISATGILLSKADGFNLEVGDEAAVDVILANGDVLPLRGCLVRSNATDAAFDFTFIPDEVEVAFWNMLGAAADARDYPQ